MQNETQKREAVAILPQSAFTVQPNLQAALLLTARAVGETVGLQMPAVDDILGATRAGRSRAYALAGRMRLSLPDLVQPAGRPRTTDDESTSDTVTDGARITLAALKFLLDHPGSAQVNDARCTYSESFRAFVVELRQQHPEIPTQTFAALCCVPWGTLKDWLAATQQPVPREDNSKEQNSEPAGQVETQPAKVRSTVTSARIATVLAEWERWDGTFNGFVEYLHRELKLSMGRRLISDILAVHGRRKPAKRPGRSPDELALRETFLSFFPNAQWSGDGKVVVVQINDQRITLNLELNVDTDSSAWVGLSVREEEDSQAVIEAFRRGIETTGSAPAAELLDNKAANHTPDVDAELDQTGTVKIKATHGRPQNKAHVEGAFGLFAQSVPELLLDTRLGPTEIAKQLLTLVATTMARVLNRRPRRDRGGKSRYELHQHQPTQEEYQAAKAALEERARRQELARQTAEQRQRPEVRSFLKDQLDALGIDDPKGYHRLALARYPLPALCDGVAIFKAKRDAGTIPEDCDPPRYLLGIVKNISARREAEFLTHHLAELRARARDHVFETLRHQQEDLLEKANDPIATITGYMRNVIDATRVLDREFWLNAAKNMIAYAHHGADALYRRAAAIANTAFSVPVETRQAILLTLGEGLVTLD